MILKYLPSKISHPFSVIKIIQLKRIHAYAQFLQNTVLEVDLVKIPLCYVASVVSNSETLRTAACQASLSMGFSRQEYYSGLPCPPPGNLPDPGIKPGPPALQADSLPLSHQGSPKDAFSPH